MAAPTIETIVIQQDAEQAIILVNILPDGDGTQHSSTNIVDISTLTVGATPTEVEIKGIHGALDGFNVTIEWDASSNTNAIVLPGYGQIYLHRRDIFGSIVNDAGAGKTGDIDLSTAGNGANEGGFIILELKKIV